MGSNPILSAIGNRINPVFMRFFHAYIAKEQGMNMPPHGAAVIPPMLWLSFFLHTDAVTYFCGTSGENTRPKRKKRNYGGHNMKNSALVVIDLQNDITKNYKEIIEKVNEAIDWAVQKGLWVVYIQHNNLSAGTRTFKPETHDAVELLPLRWKAFPCGLHPHIHRASGGTGSGLLCLSGHPHRAAITVH